MSKSEEAIKKAREYIKDKIKRSFRYDYGIDTSNSSDRLFTETVIELQKIDQILEEGETMDDVKRKENPKCCFCGKECENEWGNNPAPASTDSNAKCCNECNATIVIPARLDAYKEKTKEGE